MAHDSNAKKFTRRLRREKTLVYKMLDGAIAQREQARMVATALQAELKRYVEVFGVLPAPAPADETVIPAFEPGSVTKALEAEIIPDGEPVIE